MDPIRNPYAPGAGTSPPELAGRDGILADAGVTLGRIRAGKSAKGQMLLGLRGVGKTVLLNRIERMAREQGFHGVLLEAPEDRRLPELLVPPIRKVLIDIDRGEKVRSRARAALRALRNFAGAFKVSVGSVELGMEQAQGVADSGNMEADLTDLLIALAEAARESDTAIVILIDEVQYLRREDLAALIVAMHRIGQMALPLTFFGAGLPQLAALAGEAKSYAERLFAYPGVGALSEESARDALREPARRSGVAYEEGALDLIVRRTKGYPYFLQEWGSHAWLVAEGSPITVADAETATARAVAHLDAGFFRVRLDRLSPREKDYVRAMAELGAGPHRSGEIAARMGAPVESVAPIRRNLISKGMIFSPAHGDTSFTVPMFDDFLLRCMPLSATGAGTDRPARSPRA